MNFKKVKQILEKVAAAYSETPLPEEERLPKNFIQKHPGLVSAGVGAGTYGLSRGIIHLMTRKLKAPIHSYFPSPKVQSGALGAAVGASLYGSLKDKNYDLDRGITTNLDDKGLVNENIRRYIRENKVPYEDLNPHRTAAGKVSEGLLTGSALGVVATFAHPLFKKSRNPKTTIQDFVKYKNQARHLTGVGTGLGAATGLYFGAKGLRQNRDNYLDFRNKMKEDIDE